MRQITMYEDSGDDATPPDGRSTRWESHRAQRRRELALAARRAIHHGGPDLSMDEIAAAAGTSKSIVYRYFTDKTGLQAAVGEAVMEDITAALGEAAHSEGAPQDRVRAMVGAYLAQLDSSPNVYAFVTRGQGPATDPGAASTEPAPGTAPMRTLTRSATELIRGPLAEVLAADGSDPALASIWAAGTIGFCRHAGEAWLAQSPERRAPLPELTSHLSRWIWSGAAPAIATASPQHGESERP